MAVRRDLHAVVARRVVDELRVLRTQPLQPRRQLRAGSDASVHALGARHGRCVCCCIGLGSTCNGIRSCMLHTCMLLRW